MDKIICDVLVFICLSQCLCGAQIVTFGACPEVETMEYFEVEKFLGVWYEIERFPTWYEDHGACAYKRIEACGRHIEIEHVYVKDRIQYVLHVNTSYTAGDEAVFIIQESNIDPMGIPISVIMTDYTNYAVIYGCKNNLEMGLKYSWILSRSPTLDPEILDKARQNLNAVPYASAAYLEEVVQNGTRCAYHWTAHIDAVKINSD